ncbi:hypothetical protein ACJ41O_007189 [Fusarium nematophilum]
MGMHLINQGKATFHAQSIALCYHQFQRAGLPPLWVILGTTIGMEATDVLDRFFAMAGISEGLPTNFASYSRKLEEYTGSKLPVLRQNLTIQNKSVTLQRPKAYL